MTKDELRRRLARMEPAIEKSFEGQTLDAYRWRTRVTFVKHCVRCGQTVSRRLIVAEGVRRLVCGACRHIAYQNPKVVAAALPVSRGRIYLLRRAIEPSRGLWTFPAGFMELGESAEEAAARETMEEIQTRVRLTGLQGVYSFKEAGIITVVYNARVLGPVPSPGVESLEVRAFRPADIPWTELAFLATFQALRDWILSVK